MPSFQEFMQKRQEQQAQAGQYQQPDALKTQASSNKPQQPKYGNAPTPTGAPDYAKIAAGASAPASGGSSVTSSGRVTPGGPPPLWQQQQQLDGQTAAAQSAAAQAAGQQAHEMRLAETKAKPLPFDPNNFKPITTDPQQEAYWRFAMQSQQGIPNFFETLQEGTPVSGSPGSVWQRGPSGEWGTVELNKATPQMPPGYDPTAFTKWQAPDQARFDEGGGNLLEYLLQNPESLSPDVVSQMKGVQQDTATSMNKQLLESIKGGMAARGMTGGGQEQAATAQANQRMMQDLLGSYRDIDIKKALQDRQDQLGVLGAAEDWMGAGMDRATTGYANTLRGETLDDASKQWYYGQKQARDEAALTRALQEKLGMADVGLGKERLGEDRRQFDQMFPLNAAQILGNLGLGYGNLDLNNRQFSSDDDFRRRNAVFEWLYAGR